MVVGVGTAGCRRALLFLQRMSELSALGRIQSAVFYDCNEITVAHVHKFLRKFLGGARSGSGIQILFPNYIPLANGFMRDPRRFEEYMGPLERDLDNIVNQVMVQAERSGRSPEVIIEFMGFAPRGSRRPPPPGVANRLPLRRNSARDDATPGPRVRGMDAAIHLGAV